MVQYVERNLLLAILPRCGAYENASTEKSSTGGWKKQVQMCGLILNKCYTVL